MEELLDLLEQAFARAESLDGQHHKSRTVKLHLQRAVAELDTAKALELRGRLASGGRQVASGAVVNTTGAGVQGRFNTVPPAQIFIDPNLSAAVPAQPAAPTDEEADALLVLYNKIIKQSPNQVVSLYTEGGIENMIKVLNGEEQTGKKANQKAAYLQQLIKDYLGVKAE